MATMAAPFPFRTWSRSDWEALGIKLTPGLVAHFSTGFWGSMRDGDAESVKAYLTTDKNDIFRDPRFAHLREEFEDEHVDARAGTVTGAVGPYVGTKFLISNPLLRELGRPRQSSQLMIANRITCQMIGVVEATDISNMRTALYALATYHLFLHEVRENVDIIILGSGPVAREIVRLLAVYVTFGIRSVTICSPNSSARVAASLQQEGPMPFILLATGEEREGLKEADFVITVTSNSKQDPTLIGSKDDLSDKAVVLSLDTNSLPDDLLTAALTDDQATLVCDEIANVSKRGAQSLATYFQGGGFWRTWPPSTTSRNSAIYCRRFIRAYYQTHRNLPEA